MAFLSRWSELRTMLRRFLARLLGILEHEPSWFVEFGSGLGILVWGISALQIAYHGKSWCAYGMPLASLLLGPARWVFLFRVTYAPRAALSAVATLWWAWITCTRYDQLGFVTGISAFSALATMDFLTLGKFSAPYFRPMIEEVSGFPHREM